MSVERFSSGGPTLFTVPKLRLADSKIRVDQYIAQNLGKWWVEEVLEPAIRLATSRGHSKSFINSLQIEKISDMEYALVSMPFYTDDKKPLNIILEFGRKGFKTAPVEKKANHWVVNGKDFFSKGHWIRPKQGYNLFESVKNWGFLNKLAERISKEVSDYMEGIKFN